MGYNLDEYETVDSRIKQFYEDHPVGAITAKIVSEEGELGRTRWTVRAKVWRKRDNYESPSATGLATETDNDGYVNKTSALENAECVPLTVPILTRVGWKFYHQLQIGEEVLSYDIGTKRSEWVPLEGISTYENMPLRRVGNSRFSADFTEGHKWVIDDQLVEWGSTKVTGATRITVAARINSKARGSVEDAARLGWIFGDSTLEFSNGLATRATITQSKDANFEVLKKLFGDGRLKSAPHKRTWNNGNVSDTLPHYTWSIGSYDLRIVLGAYGVNNEDDLMQAVLSMSFDEVDAFLDSMMRSDGSRGTYAKTDKRLVEVVQVAMAITGHRVSRVSERKSNYMTTKPCFTVTMGKQGSMYLSEFDDRNIPPQDVWCPTTKNGTWIARFDGRIAITGNTSAIGRALANLGYSGKKRPSREEMEKVERVENAESHKNSDVRTDQDKFAAQPILDAKNLDELQAVYEDIAKTGAVPDSVRSLLNKRHKELSS